MANNTISQIQVNGTTYDICDATSRDNIAQNTEDIGNLQNSVSRTIINLSTGYYTSPAASTWFYTNLSVTIPAKSIYALHGRSLFHNSPPSGTAFLTRPTDFNIDYVWSYTDIFQYCNTFACGYTNSQLVLYLWSRYRTTASNGQQIFGWYMSAE